MRKSHRPADVRSPMSFCLAEYSATVFRDSGACTWLPSSSPGPVVTIDATGQMTLSEGSRVDYEHCTRFKVRVTATGSDDAIIQCDATIQVQVRPTASPRVPLWPN